MFLQPLKIIDYYILVNIVRPYTKTNFKQKLSKIDKLKKINNIIKMLNIELCVESFLKSLQVFK